MSTFVKLEKHPPRFSLLNIPVEILVGASTVGAATVFPAARCRHQAETVMFAV